MIASTSRREGAGAAATPASRRIRLAAAARLALAALALAASALASAGCRKQTASERLAEAIKRTERQNLVRLVQSVNESGEARQAAARLVSLLEDRRPRVRAAAAQALAELHAPPETTAGALIEALQDSDPEVRADATEALGRIRPISDRTAAAIAAMRNDADERVRCASVEALAEAGPAARGAIPMLIAALSDPEVGASAAEALGNMGPTAGEAVSALVGASRTGESSVRLSACRAIWKIAHDAARAAAPLPELLDENVFLPVRIGAARLAAEIGPPAAAAAGPLVVMLGSDNETAARAAAAALAAIGPKAAPLVEQAAASPDPARRQFAVIALGQLARTIPEAQASLLAALRDKAWLVRLTAVHALTASAWDRQSGPLVDALQSALNDSHPFVRTAAAGALDLLAEKRRRTGGLGEAAKCVDHHRAPARQSPQSSTPTLNPNSRPQPPTLAPQLSTLGS